MLIPLSGTSIVDWFDRVGARRNDDGRRRVMIDGCVVCRFPVISTVGSKLSHRIANLIE